MYMLLWVIIATELQNYHFNLKIATKFQRPQKFQGTKNCQTFEGGHFIRAVTLFGYTLYKKQNYNK